MNEEIVRQFNKSINLLSIIITEMCTDQARLKRFLSKELPNLTDEKREEMLKSADAVEARFTELKQQLEEHGKTLF